MKEFWAKHKWKIIGGVGLTALIIFLVWYFRKGRAVNSAIPEGSVTTGDPQFYKQGQMIVAQRALPYYQWSGRAAVGPSLGTIASQTVVQFQEKGTGYIAVKNPGGDNPAYVYIDYSDTAFLGVKN